ncbi:MAG: guanylate kinase [Lachnospiraceae bacterium]|jgi:guanylate kinase|nr:guanylate kinase [Lachnospiraceae bacterium]
MNQEKGILVVFSGFAGSGKGTIMKELMKRYPDTYALSVSATTRDPRPGEIEGREYFFKTEDEFLRLAHENQMLEFAQYVGHYYGTPRAYVEQKLEEGYDVILEIETQGALKVKELMPDTLLMFVTPPDADTVFNRLTGRGTEDTQTINRRMAKAYEESNIIGAYDYWVINDDLESCVEEVHAIIQNEHSRTCRKKEQIKCMKQQLSCYVK